LGTSESEASESDTSPIQFDMAAGGKAVGV
jgi:hypothetical protein